MGPTGAISVRMDSPERARIDEARRCPLQPEVLALAWVAAFSRLSCLRRAGAGPRNNEAYVDARVASPS